MARKTPTKQAPKQILGELHQHQQFMYTYNFNRRLSEYVKQGFGFTAGVVLAVALYAYICMILDWLGALTK